MAEEDECSTRFIDSHAHLADPAFAGDSDEVAARARLAGADAIVCIGSGSGSADTLAAARGSAVVAARLPGLVWFTAGVHPHDAAGFDVTRDITAIREHIDGGAVAVGECGLDYHYDNSPRSLQRKSFEAQLSLGLEGHVPVVVHTRDAEDDTMAMVAAAGGAGVSGVLHCYTGSRELAAVAIDVGWYISFSGIVTFRKWTDDDLLRMVPADRILAESDAPYLAPVPHRGRRNEPAWVGHTVARLASARGVTPAIMGQTVINNARRLFSLA